MHGHSFDTFVPPVSQTAIFCGMRWAPPFVVHAAHRIGNAELGEAAREYRRRLETLAADPVREPADA
jgi:glutathione-regulated potassium-efflux system ancillary protein KefF